MNTPNKLISALKTGIHRNYGSQSKQINNFNIPANFVNRNPRNLERLRIGYKPDGYHLEAPGRIFWHKLVVRETNKYATASLVHFKNGEILRASTAEWPIKKRLYRYNDVSAYINLGSVFADRCLKCGLSEISCFLEPHNPDGKLAQFLNTLKEGGIVLEEPSQYKHPHPWDQHRPEKPWSVLD